MDIKNCFDEIFKDDTNRDKLKTCCRLYTLRYISLDELKCLFSKDPFNCEYKCPKEISELSDNLDIGNLEQEASLVEERGDLISERGGEEWTPEEIDFIHHVQKKFHS